MASSLLQHFSKVQIWVRYGLSYLLMTCTFWCVINLCSSMILNYIMKSMTSITILYCSNKLWMVEDWCRINNLDINVSKCKIVTYVHLGILFDETTLLRENILMLKNGLLGFRSACLRSKICHSELTVMALLLDLHGVHVLIHYMFSFGITRQIKFITFSTMNFVLFQELDFLCDLE